MNGEGRPGERPANLHPPSTIQDRHDAEARLSWGRYRGLTIEQVAEIDENYCRWLAMRAEDATLRDAARRLLDKADEERCRRPAAVAAPPSLQLEIRLEGVPVLWLAADSPENELRLRSWLRRSDALANARMALAVLLDELDRIDAERAA
jgi:hypothetical protein